MGHEKNKKRNDRIAGVLMRVIVLVAALLFLGTTCIETGSEDLKKDINKKKPAAPKVDFKAAFATAPEGLKLDTKQSGPLTGLAELIPNFGDSKPVYDIAEKGKFTDGYRGVYEAAGLSYAMIQAMRLENRESIEPLALAWEKWIEEKDSKIQGSSNLRPLDGTLTGGNLTADVGLRYDGFSIEYFGGVQQTFLVVPVESQVFTITLQGSPTLADEKHATSWLSEIISDGMK